LPNFTGLTVSTVIETVLEGQFSISSGRAAIPIPKRKGAADLRRNVARPGIATPGHQPPARACLSFLRNISACFYTAAPSDSAYASATARRDPIPARTQPTFATWIEWSVNLIDASSAAAPAAGIRSLHPQPRSRRGRDHSIFPGTHIAGDAGGDQQGMGSAAGD
jgi:hypothetical protein